jgi:hypothetical protein
MSDEFDGLDANEKAGIGATLVRCRVLAAKIANELMRHAKKCAEAAERTTDPEIREMLLRLVADLTAAALSATSSGSTPPKPGSPSCAA